MEPEKKGCRRKVAEPALTVTPVEGYPWETRAARWIFLNDGGLRCGWSLLACYALYRLTTEIAGSALATMHLAFLRGHIEARSALIYEMVPLLGLAGAMSLMALMERRSSPLAYNLRGPRWLTSFFVGSMSGFAALSALVGAMSWGGWLQVGPVELSAGLIVKFGVLWGFAFLAVACFEEGSFRGYLQFTLTRGIDFWWALAAEAAICANLVWRGRGDGAWGVYCFALLGVIPCLVLQLKRARNSSFWQAAWVSSTLFGYIHTSNRGENWVGIFAATMIGLVFVVSIRVTGSAWWAIGCHAAWDWAETFFYGTADSGLVATGHYLSAAPAGNSLWSGGADGPEGSLLALAIILLLLIGLLAAQGLKRTRKAAPAEEAA